VSAVGAKLSLMVLADSPEGCACVDLGSGALVRTELPTDPAGAWRPFEVIDVSLADDPDPDPTQPEAVILDEPPVRHGRLRGRKARRTLAGLALPAGEQPLGFPGSAVPYWAVAGDRPSVAVVKPDRGPLLMRRHGEVMCRFGCGRMEAELPLADPRALAAVARASEQRLGGALLGRLLGYRPEYLVVMLSRPHDGRCYRVVTAVLPAA
jgi:hypothetical protein